MKLLKLSYINIDWELHDLELNQVNLIVAKNATGKSMTLRTIDLLIKIIIQQPNFLDRGGYWSTTFQNKSGQIIKYSFSKVFDEQLKQSIVTKELLFVDNDKVLERNNEEAIIKNKLNLNETSDLVYPPKNKLVLHTNRDTKKYPYLEDVTNWAENSYRFLFANIISSSNLNRTFSGLNLPDIPDLFNLLNENSRQSILIKFNSLGYNVSKIISDNKEEVTIFINENDIESPLPHWLLAQGMYRSLSIIIFLEYLVSNKKPALILIDDLCEGLDYDRAIKLGKLIFNECKDSDIQLIATSNDSFLMDVVDIKYWNVLFREGKVVTALNIKNHPKIFESFRFTGLSNFDFFSSDFLTQQLAS